MAFNGRVWSVLKKIPRGKVTTYGEIAVALKNPGAARAVGNACNKNPFAPQTPCHRVIQGNGFVGEYAKGIKQKIKLLEREGIKIKNNKVLNLERALVRAKDLV